MILLAAFSSCQTALKAQQTALFCYGDFYPQEVKGLDYVVVEPILFTAADVRVLKTQNKKVLAYISLGEVSAVASHYADIESETLSKNEIWNSYVLDISAPKTRNALMVLIEDHLVNKGFDGLFLDNVDNYTIWGPTPEKKEDLLNFLAEVKSRFRESVLMQNAGLLILKETKPYIDIVAIESVASDYNFDNNTYRLRSQKGFEERLAEIEVAKNEADIPFLLIEYAKTNKMKTAIEKRLSKFKFPLFIGQIDLQKPPVFK